MLNIFWTKSVQKLWNKKNQKFQQIPTLHRFDPLHFKQIVCPFEHLFTCSSVGMALHEKHLNWHNDAEWSEVAIVNLWKKLFNIDEWHFSPQWFNARKNCNFFLMKFWNIFCLQIETTLNFSWFFLLTAWWKITENAHNLYTRVLCKCRSTVHVFVRLKTLHSIKLRRSVGHFNVFALTEYFIVWFRVCEWHFTNT